MKLWVSSSAFLLGWLLTCLLLRALRAMPEVPQVTEKLEWLSSAGANFDTLFVGSSRVRRHLSPEIFDKVMREQGFPTKSFNLGIDGMTFPELGYVVEQSLRNAKSPLRYVVIDLNPLRRRMMKGNDLRSMREIHWHDLTRTRQAWEAVVADFRANKESAKTTAQLLAIHAVLLVRHYSSTGRGAGVLPFHLPGSREFQNAGELQNRGFHPVDAPMNAGDRGGYVAELDQMLSAEAHPETNDPVLDEVLGRVTQAIRRAGATPVFVSSPVISRYRTPQPAARLLHRPALISFEDPRRHAELFLVENRYDRQHLNLQGANLLTQKLAKEVAALIESGTAK